MKNLALVLAVATGLTGCASSSETGPSDGKGQTTAMDINRALQLAMDKCLPAAELQTVSAADLKQYGFKDSFLAGKNTVVVAVGPKVIIGFFHDKDTWFLQLTTSISLEKIKDVKLS
ncbi:hypothetical protein [Sinorhizobium medicae]|uniref:hypothetical protein n=1 Tax=Sinorhizobium medicae TaxID=110321 RepID=UPI0012FA2D46|nr:hypothetical protein [Sinorhizobium medicae]